jgi:DNA-binding SARP family transcriptional activator
LLPDLSRRRHAIVTLARRALCNSPSGDAPVTPDMEGSAQSHPAWTRAARADPLVHSTYAPPLAATRVSAPAGPWLGLLDGFRLRHRGRTLRLQPAAQRLLAFLALHDRPLHRLYVAGRLWTDSDQEHANASLRTTLWRLRRPGCVLVEATSSEMALSDDVVVDVREAVARAHRVLDSRGEPPDVAGLIGAGDLLPDLYDDWVILERERFRQLRLHSLERLCEDLTAVGSYAVAAEAAFAAIAGEPLRESAHRVLIGTHIAEGNLGEAFRQYRVFCDLAREQLGVSPSPRLRAMMSSLRETAPEHGPTQW